ncbi:MAG: ATP-dependent sacrificial sulfur transferase LarE [Candidatus Thorarchaeota archaeon]|nr:ATP-dependent sacrificial sulfur transferase LarE [Candidatus Thorarchaeota archaeon]
MKDLTATKFDTIKRNLAGKKILVAFSGGVDSTVLASIVSEVASATTLLIISSPTVPESELVGAKEIAKELGLELIVKDFNWLEEEALVTNQIDRCFRCKQILAESWLKTAQELGLDIVVEGTTASETEGYRPGAKALEDSGVHSPYLDVNITKDEIREYARRRGLSVAEKPSMACLATRFPYGTRIELKPLKMIDDVENILCEQGFRNVRARHYGKMVKIEVPPDEIGKFIDRDFREEIIKKIKAVGYTYVTLDLEGYRQGSMNEILS